MARKKSSRSRSSDNSDPRRNLIVAGVALGCTLAGGGLGYAFGYFVVPLTDMVHQFGNRDTGAIFFLYAFGIAGLLIGVQTGRSLFRSLRRKEQQRSRRERYRDHLEKFEREQAEMAEKDDGYRSDRMGEGSSRRREKEYESPWP